MGETDKKIRELTEAMRTEQRLPAPTDSIGTWRRCTAGSSAKYLQDRWQETAQDTLTAVRWYDADRRENKRGWVKLHSIIADEGGA